MNFPEGMEISLFLNPALLPKPPLQSLTETFPLPLFSPSSITISTFANGSGTVTGAGTYAYGNEASFQASPLTGHVFEEWTLTWADGNISKIRLTHKNNGYRRLFSYS